MSVVTGVCTSLRCLFVPQGGNERNGDFSPTLGVSVGGVYNPSIRRSA